jgi:hypothetical protein
MKLKVLIATLFVAGFASSFALAGGTRGAVETTTGTTGTTTTGATGTTTTPKAAKCKKVELKGSNGTGSVTFTVDKASKKSAGLKGTSVTLAISAARVQANACVDAAGVLTLRGLEVSAKKAESAKKKEAKKD